MTVMPVMIPVPGMIVTMIVLCLFDRSWLCDMYIEKEFPEYEAVRGKLLWALDVRRRCLAMVVMRII